MTSAKESSVSGLRPVDISSARTFTNLPEQTPKEDGEGSLFEACAQRLQDWENEAEVAPLWTGQRNYGTFIRPRYGTHRVQNQAPKQDTSGGAEKKVGQEREESCIVHEVARNDTIQALALKYNVLVSPVRPRHCFSKDQPHFVSDWPAGRATETQHRWFDTIITTIAL